MRLVCPNCASEYEVDAEMIPPEGRDVQCANCENVWFQEPEPEKPTPLMLDRAYQAESAPQDAPISADTAPDMGMVPPAPSTEEEEREQLRSAVREELAIQEKDEAGATTDSVAEADGKTAPDAKGEAAEDKKTDDGKDDDTVLSSLRTQLAEAKKDFNFSDDQVAKSQKRSVVAAAASAGIDASSPTRAEEAVTERKKTHERPKTLMQAIEEESGPIYRPRRKLRGFLTIVVLALIALGVYSFAPQISEAYPAADPYLRQYVGLVDQGRASVEALYDKATMMVSEQMQESQE